MDFLDFIFPKNCLGCKRVEKYICDNCLTKVKVLKQACPYCEKPSIDGFTHVKCKRKYGLDGLTSVWKYEGVIKKAIWALKFKYSTEVGKEISECFNTSLQQINIIKNVTLVPIPIYWHRENIRGFNQSIEVGKEVANKMGWGFIPDLLLKNKPTVSQVELSVKARKQNLLGVFSLNPNYELSSPFSVIIFDDVFTTGSTLHEAAKVLKHSGVKKVWGMTLAR